MAQRVPVMHSIRQSSACSKEVEPSYVTFSSISFRNASTSSVVKASSREMLRRDGEWGCRFF